MNKIKEYRLTGTIHAEEFEGGLIPKGVYVSRKDIPEVTGPGPYGCITLDIETGKREYVDFKTFSHHFMEVT